MDAYESKLRHYSETKFLRPVTRFKLIKRKKGYKTKIMCSVDNGNNNVEHGYTSMSVVRL